MKKKGCADATKSPKMKRPTHITAIPNDPIDLDRFVAALLALAVARVEAEQAERDETSKERDE